ncbi:MAG: hypothetical protein FJW64_11620 [Actinobacteria bacterium]|nr:hypothetical protein [Actinomycetota bacterium]
MTFTGVLSIVSALVTAAAVMVFLRSGLARNVRSKLRAQIVAALLLEVVVVLFVIRVLSAGQAYTAWPIVVGGGILLAVTTVLLGVRVRRWVRELGEGEPE